MSSSAQDEFDKLHSKSERSRCRIHPEDNSDASSDRNSSSDHDGTTLHSANEDEKTIASASSTIMPSATNFHGTTHFDANTGPKGVIADARSFEFAKKRSFRQSLYAIRNGEPPPIFGKKVSNHRGQSNSPSPESSADDEEDDFMRTWRANRLDELTATSRDIRTRRQSPSKPRFGSLVAVDPSGYLDAVEKVHSDTIVVVLIYDDSSAISCKVEDALENLAHKHVTTRFIRLHFLEAEMDEIAVPGILAYRGGDCFANLVSFTNEMPAGRELSITTVERTLQEHRILC